MKDRYSRLLVFVEGINRPYLLNKFNMKLYSIINGDFYEEQTKIGKVIAFNVEHKIPMKLGEHPCPELKCSCCPLSFCCDGENNWAETPFNILEKQFRKKMPVKTYKFLYKLLCKDITKELEK